jgi:hypothetical protein
MLFRRLRKSASIAFRNPGAQQLSQSLSTEQRLIEALASYREAFIGKIEPSLDPRAYSAAELVARAENLIAESGIGPALAPTLLEEVKHWPSWSKRDDFQKWMHFPATDVFGADERNEQGHKIARVNFRYKDRQYGVHFVDEGYDAWQANNDDPSLYGKVELSLDGETVLGLDISLKLSPDHASWRWTRLFAFMAGAWMKDLIEIATYIELDQGERLDKAISEDAIERASRIKL